VKQEFAPGNPKLYGGAHKMFPGAQVTLASRLGAGLTGMPLRMGGRAGAPRAHRQRRRAVERPGRRTDHRQEQGDPRQVEAQHRVMRGREVCQVPDELPKITEADLKTRKDFS